MRFKNEKQEQALAREMRSNGVSIPEIALRLRVAKSSVSLWVRDVVLTKQQQDLLKGGGVSFVPSEAVTLFHQGLSYQKIADALGVKVGTLRHWFLRNGYSRKYRSFNACQCCWRPNRVVKARFCNTCHSSIRRFATKIRAVEMLGSKCMRCERSFGIEEVSAFELHHPDPNGKDFNFSDKHNIRWDKVKIEILKCELLCSCCHRIEHSKIYSNGTVKAEAIKKAKGYL